MTTEITQALSYRLQRKGSIGLEIVVRVLVTLVWNAFFWWFISMAWTHGPGDTPVFIWAILALFALIGLGMVWDVVVRIARAALGRVPIVEVDRQPARLGEALTVRVSMPDPASLSSLQVELVGVTITTSGAGTTTRDGIRTPVMKCMASELAAISHFDRTASFTMPSVEQVPEGTVCWELCVGLVLAQGGLLVSAFPIEVGT